MNPSLRSNCASIRLLPWTAVILAAVLLLFAAAPLTAASPGFRSQQQLVEHYHKHGSEFGNISMAEYLRRAQDLRDAPSGPTILRADRPGGIMTKFDRRRGWFGSYNRDGTVRTFFVPNDGERYFRRQAGRR